MYFENYPTDMLIGPYKNVSIIGVINPEQICVHLQDEEDLLNRILCAVNETPKSHEEVHRLLEEEVYPGKAVLYREDDETFYRATIIEKSLQEITIWLGDYGWEAVTTLDELYTPPQWMYKVPYQAVIVGIRGIEPIRSKYTAKSSNIVREIVKDETWTLEVDVEETNTDAIWGSLFLETANSEDRLNYTDIMRVFSACRKSDKKRPFKFQAPGPVYCSVCEHVNKFMNFSHEEIHVPTPASVEYGDSDTVDAEEEGSEEIEAMEMDPIEVTGEEREFLTCWGVMEASTSEDEESDGYLSNSSC